MKTVAAFPAFDVIDLEQDVICIAREQMDNFTGLKFCVAKETLRHGTLYPEVRPYCAAYYAQDYNECPVAAETRCDDLKHEKYWVGNCGAMITSEKRNKGVRIFLKPGQKIEMNGVLLEFYQKAPRSEHYGLKPVVA
jgi:hypothetical protein